jgi:hypothetical protein
MAMTKHVIKIYRDFNSDKLVALQVIFIFPRQRKADFKKVGGSMILKSEVQTFPRWKDLNNLVKFVIDALKGVM